MRQIQAPETALEQPPIEENGGGVEGWRWVKRLEMGHGKRQGRLMIKQMSSLDQRVLGLKSNLFRHLSVPHISAR